MGQHQAPQGPPGRRPREPVCQAVQGGRGGRSPGRRGTRPPTQCWQAPSTRPDPLRYRRTTSRGPSSGAPENWSANGSTPCTTKGMPPVELPYWYRYSPTTGTGRRPMCGPPSRGTAATWASQDRWATCSTRRATSSSKVTRTTSLLAALEGGAEGYPPQRRPVRGDHGAHRLRGGTGRPRRSRTRCPIGRSDPSSLQQPSNSTPGKPPEYYASSTPSTTSTTSKRSTATSTYPTPSSKL